MDYHSGLLSLCVQHRYASSSIFIYNFSYSREEKQFQRVRNDRFEFVLQSNLSLTSIPARSDYRLYRDGNVQVWGMFAREERLYLAMHVHSKMKREASEPSRIIHIISLKTMAVIRTVFLPSPSRYKHPRKRVAALCVDTQKEYLIVLDPHKGLRIYSERDGSFLTFIALPVHDANRMVLSEYNGGTLYITDGHLYKYFAVKLKTIREAVEKGKQK
jgi:hypothetical protein